MVIYIYFIFIFWFHMYVMSAQQLTTISSETDVAVMSTLCNLVKALDDVCIDGKPTVVIDKSDFIQVFMMINEMLNRIQTRVDTMADQMEEHEEMINILVSEIDEIAGTPCEYEE